MWDSEIYVLPAVLVFHPELAKRMLRYRTMLFEQAKANAEEAGEEGARSVLQGAYMYALRYSFWNNRAGLLKCRASLFLTASA